MKIQADSENSRLAMINQKSKFSEFLKGTGQRFIEKLPSIVKYGYAFLFMYTGLDKLQNIEQFSFGLKSFPYLGEFAELISWFIPSVEIALAIMFILPFVKVQRWVLFAATVLMGIFCLYVGAVVFFVEKAPCNCGGVIKSMGWSTHLLFNITWFYAGIYAFNNKK